jgi:AmiR/NasT family two-component response regulator
VSLLADRKLIEMAKRVLQATFQWNEEQTYFYIRNASRRRRTAMREIAWEVIEHLAPEGAAA